MIACVIWSPEIAIREVRSWQVKMPIPSQTLFPTSWNQFVVVFLSIHILFLLYHFPIFRILVLLQFWHCFFKL